MFSPLLLAFFLPFALSGRPHHLSLRSRHLTNTLSSQTFVLKDLYQGQNLLDQFDFFTDPDPTGGNVNFQSRKDATAKNLAFVNHDGSVVLAVDNTSTVPVGGNRDSVRIFSQKTYTHGLFVADFKKMPHGCSVWPAYWTVGANWPNAGEIDIVEGVNNQKTNLYSLHTSGGCDMTPVKQKPPNALSVLLGTQCASGGDDNKGCGFSDSSPTSYGHNFNAVNGGVFAHLWDSTGIKIWRFTRDKIPNDITVRKPNPSSWGEPVADFPSVNCNIDNHFFKHSLVLDITLCGGFANGAYPSSGCPGTCKEALSKNANFMFARFEVNYLSVYETK